MKTFIFTSGDVNGIGLEIIIKTLNKKRAGTNSRFIIISPQNAFYIAAEIVKPQFKYKVTSDLQSSKELVTIYDIGKVKLSPGKNTKEAGLSAYNAIRCSFDLLQGNMADAVVTAPISKTAIKMAGINFPGHTEMYASWCGIKKYVMMFLSSSFNAALLTIHEPISKIPKLITPERIQDYLSIVFTTLKENLRLEDPSIAVLGLNPHAGESGIMGLEEEKIIKPAIKKFKYANGPFSPDAFFANKLYKNFDCVLGMYHDQVLIPFKMLNFSAGVNFTAGLPVIRTSPDHGTAFDIAGKGIADPSSMIEALHYADKFITSRRKFNAKI